ncbi:MAG: hypothetical protein IKA80_06235 [Spirochaetaceae bacterium]|nr:hypothetical protein [Spirochaetaceae bacterium]
MRKTTIAVAGALFLAAVLALTGCPNSATVQPAGDKTPSNTGETKTEKTEALTTSGTMEKPALQADGSATLTSTDSNGGRYTFTQPAAPSASIRSVSSGGGTWDYTNKGGIKQYEGSYSGDITSSGANNLSLTVEKAADPSGKLQEVTEPQSFDFEVSASGTFSATIPAVEIVVQVEPPAGTSLSIIKTVTMTHFFSSGKDFYYDQEGSHTINFYSNKTFTWRMKFIRTLKEVNFSYTIEGPALVGTYTDDSLTDGTVLLNVQKWSKFLVSGVSITSPELTEVFTAYRSGASSKTVTITEADLIPFTTTYPIIISGDTFSDTDSTSISTYIPNDDGSTTFTVEAYGDDVASFKLYYQMGENNGDGSYSYSSGDPSGYGNFSETISITDAAENTAIFPYIFIDKDGSGTMDRGTDVVINLTRIDLKPRHHTTTIVDIKKHSIDFTIEGDTSQYQDIYVSAGYYGPTVPMSAGSIDVYTGNIRDSGSIRFIDLKAEEHIPEGSYPNTYDISDTIELYLDEGAIPASITLTLYNKLKDGKKITIKEHPVSETSAEEEQRFRFEQEVDGNLIFYIPTGTGSDGAFLSSTYRSPKDSLIAFTYLGLRPKIQAVENNHTYQFTGLIENMKDVVWFLENRMKLTVHGKELIGLN